LTRTSCLYIGQVGGRRREGERAGGRNEEVLSLFPAKASRSDHNSLRTDHDTIEDYLHYPYRVKFEV
jgi:hypothetical protein